MGTYEPLSKDVSTAIEAAVPSKNKKRTKAKINIELEKSKFSIYSLLQEVNNGILFFGKVQAKNNSVTAEFICSCGEAFRSELRPIASGSKKSCGCKTKKRKSSKPV